MLFEIFEEIVLKRITGSNGQRGHGCLGHWDHSEDLKLVLFKVVVHCFKLLLIDLDHMLEKLGGSWINLLSILPRLDLLLGFPLRDRPFPWTIG